MFTPVSRRVPGSGLEIAVFHNETATMWNLKYINIFQNQVSSPVCFLSAERQAHPPLVIISISRVCELTGQNRCARAEPET
jgi:hypothetical protein